MKNMRTLLLVLLLFLMSCAPVEQTYVEADRATYEAVAGEYLGYVEADPRLSPEQVERRKRTILSWEARAFKQEQPDGGK